MDDEALGYLTRQFDTAWSLTAFHLRGLTAEECLWRPGAQGLHVHQDPDGRWRADWPTHEGFDLGPSSIAWLTWHLGFWWSMVLNHSFGDGALVREDIVWPGADRVNEWLNGLEAEWHRALGRLTAERPAISPANPMAVPGPSVWRRRRVGQCGAHQERRRDRLCAFPLCRQGRQRHQGRQRRFTVLARRGRSSLAFPTIGSPPPALRSA